MKGLRFHALLLCAALGACAGFPSKHPPVSLADSLPLEGFTTAGGGSWPLRQWWKRYRDPTLDQLIDMASAGSPTLETARARFDTARQSVRLAAAAAGAQVSASGDADRQRLSDNGFIPPHLLGFSWYNQFDLGLQATYTFDWWGKQQHAVEAALDQAHAAQADRNAAAMVLAASVADAYFGWQADQSRLSLAHEKERVVLAEDAIIAARVQADLEAGELKDRSQLALAAAREQIAALEGSIKLRLVTLAALAGHSISELPAFDVRALPPITSGIPDDVKIDLISRRADITASRWRVESAEKNLAAARAAFFPDISINALAGLQSIDASRLLQYGSRVPEIGAAIHLPIFDAGRLQAQYGGANAAIDAAVASYQETLVSAARDVATQAAMRDQYEAQSLERLQEVAAAERIKRSSAARVTQGLVDQRTEYTAAESWIEQRDGLLQLQAAALSADISLQRALGGGYEDPETKKL